MCFARSAERSRSGRDRADPIKGRRAATDGDTNSARRGRFWEVTPTVTPAVNCITTHTDGTFTALFGYTNSSGATVTLSKGGPDNSISPSNLDGPQPDTFASGTTYGAFSVTVPAGGTATWTLHGNRQAVASASSLSCGPPVSMPQDGNGFGVIIMLVIAAAVGVVTVLRTPSLH
jgi:hypothetical protein